MIDVSFIKNLPANLLDSDKSVLLEQEETLRRPPQPYLDQRPNALASCEDCPTFDLILVRGSKTDGEPAIAAPPHSPAISTCAALPPPGRQRQMRVKRCQQSMNTCISIQEQLDVCPRQSRCP